MSPCKDSGRSQGNSMLIPKTFAGIFAFFCIVLLLGISSSAIAAMHDIQSILAYGRTLSVLGLGVALGCMVSRSAASLLFGLSTPALSLGIFFLIFWKSWSPSQAAIPVALIILGYEALVVPLGLYTLYRTLAPAPRTFHPRAGQFNLGSLFMLMLILFLTLGVARPFLHFDIHLGHSLAQIMFVLTLFASGITLWLSLRLHFLAAPSVLDSLQRAETADSTRIPPAMSS